MIDFKPGMIVKNKLDGKKMILIASQVEIDSGDMHCRYFSDATGMYEEEYFELCEIERWTKSESIKNI